MNVMPITEEPLVSLVGPSPIPDLNLEASPMEHDAL